MAWEDHPYTAQAMQAFSIPLAVKVSVPRARGEPGSPSMDAAAIAVSAPRAWRTRLIKNQDLPSWTPRLRLVPCRAEELAR